MYICSWLLAECLHSHDILLMNDCIVTIVSILCIIMKFKSIAYDNAYFVSVSTIELFIQIMTWYELSGVLKLIIGNANAAVFSQYSF